MYGLRFEDQPSVVTSDPNRADVACFVGYVESRGVALPPDVARWLADRRWIPALKPNVTPASDLYQIPTPIDTWEVFDRLFAWERRPLREQGGLLPTYLGAAVRTFFAQGGRKCYVVAVAKPWPYLEEAVGEDERTARMAARVEALIPGYGGGALDASPVEPFGPHGWRGVAHLFGLEDAAMVCLPDLPDIVRSQTVRIDNKIVQPPPPEGFVECSAPQPQPPPDLSLRRIAAPRCDDAGYAAWAKAVRLIAVFLHDCQPQTELIAALPIPALGSQGERNPLNALAKLPSAPLNGGVRTADGIGSAFVQLAFPWVRTSASDPLPEGVESPDAVLAGMLARSALVRGGFTTVAGQPPLDVYDLVPALHSEQIDSLQQRVSLLARTPRGLRLLSDVTLAAARTHRQAHIGRLTAGLLRAARTLGESISFSMSSETLWRQARDQLTMLLEQMRAAGALRGALPDDAYQVRCDRSTMTQNDIDNGRVVAEVRFDPAASVDAITVVLALHEGGQATIAGRE